jgi:hypothetical protein
MRSYNEGVGDSAEDAVFVVDVVHLLRVDDVHFLHDLDTGVSVRTPLLDQPDLAEGTLIIHAIPSPKMLK